MPEAIIYCSDITDAKKLSAILDDTIAFATEDEWDVFATDDYKLFSESAAQKDAVGIAVFDVTDREASALLEKTRADIPDAFLVLTADRNVPPTRYIRPSIMASALLLKPLNPDAVKQCFKEIINLYYQRLNAPETGREDKFCLDTRGQKSFIPIDKIIYFEAREKKISLNTRNNEYTFYSSLDTLEQDLPACMIRCHRSFIVNINHVIEVVSSQNLIYCTDDTVVPLSRTYKSRVTKALGGGES